MLVISHLLILYASSYVRSTGKNLQTFCSATIAARVRKRRVARKNFETLGKSVIYTEFETVLAVRCRGGKYGKSLEGTRNTVKFPSRRQRWIRPHSRGPRPVLPGTTIVPLSGFSVVRALAARCNILFSRKGSSMEDCAPSPRLWLTKSIFTILRILNFKLFSLECFQMIDTSVWGMCVR